MRLNHSCFKYLLILAFCLPLYLKADIPFYRVFNFSNDHQGWTADFTDYPVGAESFYELAWGWENFPPSEGDKGFTKGLFLSGNNHSDDLFMFIKRQIDGLKPNSTYNLLFEVTLASKVPEGTTGIGGSPGESVYVKVGASSEEPKKTALSGHYFLNVDKGDQSMGGKNAVVIGSLANPLVDPNNPEYIPMELTNTTLIEAKTDENGKLWIFLGTDSGYEGTSKYYILSVTLNGFSIASDAPGQYPALE